MACSVEYLPVLTWEHNQTIKLKESKVVFIPKKVVFFPLGWNNQKDTHVRRGVGLRARAAAWVGVGVAGMRCEMRINKKKITVSLFCMGGRMGGWVDTETCGSSRLTRRFHAK